MSKASAKRESKGISVVLPDGTPAFIKGRPSRDFVLVQWNEVSGWNVCSTHKSRLLAQNAQFQNSLSTLKWEILNV